MELFSEIYNCYYQILKSILQNPAALTKMQLNQQICEGGYEESVFHMIPKLSTGDWNLMQQDGDMFFSKISEDFFVPLTNLQKAYLKTILQDERIQLFFTEAERKELSEMLCDVEVLWRPDDFYYYDRFSNKDNYSDPVYQEHFRTLLQAIHEKRYVDICYEAKNNHRVHHHYLPCRLEYSMKNDKFRLLGISRKSYGDGVETLNLERMREVKLLPDCEKELPDINKRIRATYYKEPVRLLIHTDRNALERAMLQFANYEKNTTKIDDNTYECLIYYNQSMETELLIEVLSFGPMVEVLGNEHFLKQLKARLYKQKRLLCKQGMV